jgi:putative hydrolase of the HAD superfamily
VKAVLFDFAGTLFDDRALRDAHLRQLRFVAGAAGIEASDADLRAAYRRAMGAAYRVVAARPSYSHRDLFGAAFATTAVALGGAIDEATADKAVDRQYRATIDEAALRPDCLDSLAALRQASIHVQVVSNIDEEQFQPMLDRLGLRTALDAWTSSDEAGSCKPDAAIFQLALVKAGVDPDEALFVGDSIHHDVLGPAALGMHTAWMAPHTGGDPGDARPDAIIHTLSDVLDLVGVGAVP